MSNKPPRAQDSSAGQPDDDLHRVSAEIAGRIIRRGVWLSGSESPDELLRLEEAIERFERIVVPHGGDLMIEEPPVGGESTPGDPMRLPRRAKAEQVERYLQRVAAAGDALRGR